MLLLKPTLRHSFLRIACICAFLLSIVAIPSLWFWKCPFVLESRVCRTWQPTLAVAAPCITFFHHFLSAFTPSLPAILNIFLHLIEIAAIVVANIPWTIDSVPFRAIGTTGYEYVTYLALSCVLVSSLVILLVMRSLEMYNDHGRGWSRLIRRTDVASSNGNGSRLGRRLLRGLKVLTGTSVWRKGIAGEAGWQMGLRGIAAILTVLCIAAFAFVNIILKPTVNEGLELSKEGLLYNTNEFSLPSWTPSKFINTNVIVSSSVPNSFRDPLHTLIEVSLVDPYDDSLIPCTTLPSCQRCNHYRFASSQVDHTLAEFTCGTVYPDEFLVTVNFTSFTRISSRQVMLMVGFTNDTYSVLRYTEPTVLLPGLDFIGFMGQRIQRTLTPVSFLGFFESFETLIISEMDVVTNPQSGNADSNMSSIRIRPRPDYSYHVKQDYQEASIFQGFASVGGLWTFVAAVFALIFGTSIMRTTFGSKPISILGLVHLFREEHIRKACIDEYPRLAEDMRTAPEDRGLVSFVSDQLFELDFLNEGEEVARDEENVHGSSIAIDIEIHPGPHGDDEGAILLENIRTSSPTPDPPATASSSQASP